MRVEHDCVARRRHADDIARHRGDGMCAGRHRTDDAERREFLQRDAVVAAQAVRIQELDARNVALTFELINLVIQPANFRFLQLQPAPLLRFRPTSLFDQFDHLLAARHAGIGQLQEGFLRGGAGFVGVRKHAERAAPGPGCRFRPKRATTGGDHRRRGRRRGRRPTTQPAQHFRHHITDQGFVHGAHAFPSTRRRPSGFLRLLRLAAPFILDFWR
ncbi:MAG: hypothetical protein BWX84_02369 [Verrucomicrobia bacterium ADurb.Bin118]|nr:MAG: hypothetical protein BWX84_02369 [Verrucomicrobia bacterium ADurb.Bin118]